MRIAFVTDFYFPSVGGVEVETRRLAHLLADEGHNVWIIAPTDKRRTKSKEGSVNVVGVKSYQAPIYKSFRFIPFFLAKKRAFKILRDIRPDVIHIQTGMYLGRAASLYARRFNIASIATGHYADGDFESNFKTLRPIASFAIKSFQKHVLENADILTVPSQMSRKYFSELVKNQKIISVISNGIDLRKFSGRSEKQSDKKVLLFVGRLEPSKNVETAITAMVKIVKKINAVLILVGGGSREIYLRNLARHLGVEKNVSFMGFLPEDKVKKMYKRADVFVTASLAENQPLTILEALASGLPIIATNVGGIPELVKDGENGFLFEPSDSGALSKNAIRILSDKKVAAKMSAESLKIISEHDIGETVYKMESLYQKAIAINNRKGALPLSASHRWLFARVAFAVVMATLLFRWTFLTPSTAKANGVKMRDRIKNSKIVKSVERAGLKLEASLYKKL